MRGLRRHVFIIEQAPSDPAHRDENYENYSVRRGAPPARGATDRRLGTAGDRASTSSKLRDGEDVWMPRVALATPTQVERLAGLLVEDPTTVIIGSQVRRGAARVWVVGDPAEPVAVAYDGDLSPGDLHCIGTVDGIVEFSAEIEDWHSIAVEPGVAAKLMPLLLPQHPTLHAIDDMHHVLRRPPTPRRHPDVRLATSADLDALRMSGLFDESLPIEAAITEGLVACADVEGRIVGQASCVAASDRYGDVGVGVDVAYRRRGLAAAAAAMVCAQLQAGGRTPVWSTGSDNVGSLRTAATLGFEPTDGLVILSRFE